MLPGIILIFGKIYGWGLNKNLNWYEVELIHTMNLFIGWMLQDSSSSNTIYKHIVIFYFVFTIVDFAKNVSLEFNATMSSYFSKA